MSASNVWIRAAIALFFLSSIGACGSNKKSDDSPTPQVETPSDENAESEFLFTEENAKTSQNQRFTAAVVWEDGPKVGYCQIKLILADAERRAPSSQELIKFEPFMTVHGHGGSLKKMTITPIEGEPSSYRIAMFYLTMSGPWDLNINAMVNDQEDSLVVPIQVP